MKTVKFGQILAVLLLALGLGTPTHASSLTAVSLTPVRSSADLTALGTLDWATWGDTMVYACGASASFNGCGVGASTSLAPTDSMSGGSGISNLTAITNGNDLRGLGQYFNDAGAGQTTFNWSNGTPNAVGSSVYAGLQHIGYPNVGEGFSFTVAASTNLEQLAVFDDVHGGWATLTASLTENVGGPLTETQSMTIYGGNYPYESIIDFAADAPGQTLTVTLQLTQDNIGDGTANVGIQAAALSNVQAPPATTPEPGTIGLVGMSLLGLIRKLKRR